MSQEDMHEKFFNQDFENQRRSPFFDFQICSGITIDPSDPELLHTRFMFRLLNRKKIMTWFRKTTWLKQKQTSRENQTSPWNDTMGNGCNGLFMTCSNISPPKAIFGHGSLHEVVCGQLDVASQSLRRAEGAMAICVVTWPEADTKFEHNFIHMQDSKNMHGTINLASNMSTWMYPCRCCCWQCCWQFGRRFPRRAGRTILLHLISIRIHTSILYTTIIKILVYHPLIPPSSHANLSWQFMALFGRTKLPSALWRCLLARQRLPACFDLPTFQQLD